MPCQLWAKLPAAPAAKSHGSDPHLYSGDLLHCQRHRNGVSHDYSLAEPRHAFDSSH